MCGNGRAAKDQVARMVCALLSLAPEQPLPDHATDALAVGVCHANHAPLHSAINLMKLTPTITVHAHGARREPAG